MSALLCVRERTEGYLPPEEEVARRWWSLPLGTLLPADNGMIYQLLFAGRPGGAKGPDVRDVVLRPLSSSSPLAPAGLRQTLQAPRLCGDVEFHVRTSDWRAHRHESDIRYNQVILHIVLHYDDAYPTIRQDGQTIPTCTLADLPARDTPQQPTSWPCQSLISQMTTHEREAMLRQAGLLRFEQKCEYFVERLHTLVQNDNKRDQAYDSVLLPALAEALAYGRDRAFFHAAGKRLLRLPSPLPEPEGRAARPSPLDTSRLRFLARLVEQAQSNPLWSRLRAFLRLSTQTQSILRLLQNTLTTQGLSLARADILICNVVLPFGAAVALVEHDTSLYTCTRLLYATHPGLASNRVTRTMSAQLQLAGEPAGACQQQGLHYIYQHTCRVKDCARCIVGRRGI